MTKQETGREIGESIPKCAYCGGAGPFTKEHVFPAWLYKCTKDYDQQWFKGNPNNFTNDEIKIRDTCGPCNHGNLSLLDNYATTLYKDYFGKFAEPGKTIPFAYDFDRLTRWLLKVSYNSARVNKSEDQNELSKLAGYILTGSSKPRHLNVFLRLIIPHRLPPEDYERLQQTQNYQGPKERQPELIRVGAEDSLFKPSLGVCRRVEINAYEFYVLLPRKDDTSRQEWKRLIREFQSLHRGTVRLPPTQSKIPIRSSNVDAFDVIKDQVDKHLGLYLS